MAVESLSSLGGDFGLSSPGSIESEITLKRIHKVSKILGLAKRAATAAVTKMAETPEGAPPDKVALSLAQRIATAYERQDPTEEWGFFKTGRGASIGNAAAQITRLVMVRSTFVKAAKEGRLEVDGDNVQLHFDENDFEKFPHIRQAFANALESLQARGVADVSIENGAGIIRADRTKLLNEFGVDANALLQRGEGEGPGEHWH